MVKMMDSGVGGGLVAAKDFTLGMDHTAKLAFEEQASGNEALPNQDSKHWEEKLHWNYLHVLYCVNQNQHLKPKEYF